MPVNTTKKFFKSSHRQDFPDVWFADGFKQGNYLSAMWGSQLGKNEKHLLAYIASMSNFTELTPCWTGVSRILNDTDWSKQTLDASKNKLMDLDWIVCYGRGRFSDLYYPRLGKPDPEHKWKDKNAREAALEKRKAKQKDPASR